MELEFSALEIKYTFRDLESHCSEFVSSLAKTCKSLTAKVSWMSSLD
jgi:hypothetical protein